MASNFTTHHISSPQLLEHVDPKILCGFLRKYRDFFVAEKAMPAGPDKIDYDRLSLVIATPSEQMPAELMADLFYWDGVAEAGRIEDLLEIAQEHGIEFDDRVTVEEATLLVRMGAPRALEDLYDVYQAHGLLRKKKRFLLYSATARELPAWKKPSRKVLDAFASDMDAWYDDQKKGRGTRVSVIEKNNAAWVIVRHGGTFKRENALENGQPKLVFYRPEAYDLLIYHCGQGHLEIYNDSNGIRERRAYCRLLGKHLFGDVDFFELSDGKKFSLEPLRKKGRAAMDCRQIDGVHSARLCQLQYRFAGGNHHRVTHAAEDVFSGFEDLGEAIPEGAELISMGVKITPDGLGGERMVRLREPNISVYDHESDAEIAHRFLAAQGFIVGRNGGARR